jgi:hypothetical protein
MRKKSLLLLAALASVTSLRAADDDKPAPQAPPENLYFNTDEFVYIPQFTFTYGYRVLSGAKTNFRGYGSVGNYNIDPYLKDITTVITRSYQDGGVGIDQRRTSSGTAIGSDGMTNNWTYNYIGQEATAGYIAFHSYTASVEDTGDIAKGNGNEFGMDINCARDVGKIGRVLVGLNFGVGLNDLTQGSTRNFDAKVHVIEDLYWLNGAAAPGAGTGTTYTSPNYNSKPVYGPNGEVVYVDTTSSTAGNQTVLVNDTVLIGNTPSARNEYDLPGTIKNTFKVKGSFVTFRLGPTFMLPVTAKLHFSLSFGAAVAYIGSNYTVDSAFTPDLGLDADKNPVTIDPLTHTTVGYEKTFTAGYFCDANVEYWLTERTGFYAGAIFQNSGHYSQTIKTDTSQYSSRVDLSSMNGLRSGMSYRF